MASRQMAATPLVNGTDQAAVPPAFSLPQLDWYAYNNPDVLIVFAAGNFGNRSWSADSKGGLSALACHHSRLPCKCTVLS